MAQLHAAQVEGPGGLRLLRQRRLHSRAWRNLNNREADLRHGLQGRLGHRAGESARRPSAARDEGARGHAAPADLLRHAEDARPDGGGRLLPARLPAGGREHLDGGRGDPRRQAAAEGLGDRRRTRPSATSASGSGTRRRSRSSTAPGRSSPTRRPACWSRACCAAASPRGPAAGRFARRSTRPASAATAPTTAWTTTAPG